MKKLIAIFFFFSSSAFAGDLVCSGKVEALSYHANNKFMIKLSSMNHPVFFCNPSEEWSVPGTSYKTSSETCKMFYSTFLAAKSAGKEIKKMHFDGADKPEKCNEFGTWKSINIRHFIFE